MHRSHAIALATLLVVALAAPHSFATPVFSGGGRSFQAFASDAAVGDFNEDGLPDVIGCNQQSPTVTLLFGDGRGGMSPPTNLAVGTGPSSIAVGFFDGDGHLDFVTANSGAGTVSVRYGRGDGTFDAVPDVSAGTSPRAIAAGDLDLDGDLDLVLVDEVGNQLRAILNIGGTFPAVTFSLLTGFSPVSIVLGDFDGDLYPDVAIGLISDVNASTRGAYVYRGVGDGSFDVGRKIHGLDTHALAAADLDGDGKNDLVVDGGVFFGHGDRTFEARLDLGLSADADVAVTDVDGNGIPDVIAGNAGSFSVVRGLGARTFAPPEVVGGGCSPTAVAVGDLNGDGRPDVAFANANGFQTLLNVNHGLGNVFRDPAPIAGVAVGDLNHDGKDDVVYLNDHQAVVRLSLGAGMFAAPVAIEVGADPNKVAIGELTGDAHADLVVTRSDAASPVQVLRGLGDGTFEPVPVTETVASPTDLATADLNGDGRLDVVVARVGGLVVLLGAGDGTFAAMRDIVMEGAPGHPQSLGVGDWNGDGHTDLVTVSYGPSTDIRTWRNSGNGLDYVAGVVYSGGVISFAAEVGVGHYSSGQWLDFVTASRGSRASNCIPGTQVRTFRGNGAGSFSMRPPISFQGPVRETGIADLDQDGQPDLLVVSETDGLVVAADGSVSVTLQKTFGTAAAFGHATGDFDGDGTTDVAVYGDEGVTILMNTTYQVAAAPGPPGRALRLGAPYPNPARALVRIPFSLPAAAHARVRILDAQGRMVRTVFDGTLEAGAHALHWDRAGAAGRRVAPGVYFCELSVNGAKHARRVVVVD